MTTENETMPINTAIPLDLHPANMSGAAPNLTHALSAAYKVWSQIEDADGQLLAKAQRTRPKPPGRKMTDVEAKFYERDVEAWARQNGAFRKDLAKKAQPKIENASTLLARALASAQGQIDTLEAQIKHKLTPHPPTGSIHTEIRERLGKKPTLSRLQEFIKSGDPIIVGTIVGSHPLLLGIDQKTHDTLKETAAKEYAAEEKAQLDAVKVDLQKFESARTSFINGMNKKCAALDSEEARILDNAFESGE